MRSPTSAKRRHFYFAPPLTPTDQQRLSCHRPKEAAPWDHIYLLQPFDMPRLLEVFDASWNLKAEVDVLTFAEYIGTYTYASHLPRQYARGHKPSTFSRLNRGLRFSPSPFFTFHGSLQFPGYTTFIVAWRKSPIEGGRCAVSC